MTTEVAQAVARHIPKLGRKPIYLPSFTLTLVRTPNHPPTFASFIVPLNLNKLDLRDYLFNCYGVTVRGVRSYIQQQKLIQDYPGAKNPRPRRWHRPRSIKRMMVELDQPFVWPEEPESLDLWDKKTFDAAQEQRSLHEEQFRPGFRERPARDRESIGQQAKALLQGKEKWRSTPVGEQWQDIGEAEEVETHVDVVKATRD